MGCEKGREGQGQRTRRVRSFQRRTPANSPGAPASKFGRGVAQGGRTVTPAANALSPRRHRAPNGPADRRPASPKPASARPSLEDKLTRLEPCCASRPHRRVSDWRDRGRGDSVWSRGDNRDGSCRHDCDMFQTFTLPTLLNVCSGVRTRPRPLVQRAASVANEQHRRHIPRDRGRGGRSAPLLQPAPPMFQPGSHTSTASAKVPHPHSRPGSHGPPSHTVSPIQQARFRGLLPPQPPSGIFFFFLPTGKQRPALHGVAVHDSDAHMPCASLTSSAASTFLPAFATAVRCSLSTAICKICSPKLIRLLSVASDLSRLRADEERQTSANRSR